MKKKLKILIVDDNALNRSLLSDILSPQYTILEAADGMEAVGVLKDRAGELSLVLLDIVMPKLDGFEVLAYLNKSGLIGSLPVIMISSETAPVYIDHAYDLGATDFISRPFEEKVVFRRVNNTVALYSKQKMLEGMVTEQIIEKEKNNQLMVEILSNIVEFRNGESGMHVLHIRTATDLLLRQLLKITDRYPLTEADISVIVNASALHDIGKISIPAEILNKPARLTKEEFEVIKTHSAIGAEMLRDAPYSDTEPLIRAARDICRWHHERYDGKGYPDGLVGDEIPVSAQVVALADVYDALTSERVYKPALSHETAMRMILDGECGSFNPVLLESLVAAGPYLAEKLRVNSPKSSAYAETRHLADMFPVHVQTPGRTLETLDRERTKYRFFTSLTREIQFEHNLKTDLLTFSEWGAAQLGLEETILHPAQNEGVLSVLSTEDFLDLSDALRVVSKKNPVVKKVYTLRVNNRPRRYEVVARPLWQNEDSDEIVSTIGKFSPLEP